MRYHRKLGHIQRLLEKGLSVSEIGKRFKLKDSSVRRYIRYLNRNTESTSKDEGFPKILIIDIETAPLMTTVWGVFKQRIPLENIQKEWFILSWSAKYLFDYEIMSDVLTPEEAVRNDDSRILKSIWNLIDEADIIIGHNVKKFDLRKLNARFIINDLMPPHPYRVIDTLLECKKYFAFTGYNLDYINKILGNKGKIHTSYKLWLKCISGDNDALKTMEKYNKNDVLITEDLYVAIRGWMKSHPNIALYYNEIEEEKCPTCGNKNLDWKGYYYTTVGRFKSGRCNTCNAIFRSRQSDLTKEERKKLLTSVAR